MRRSLYIGLFLGLFFSCASSKKLMEVDLPSPGLVQTQDVVRSQRSDPTNDPLAQQFKLASGVESDQTDTTSVLNQLKHTDESGNSFSIMEAAVDSATGESIGNVQLKEVEIMGQTRIVPERKGVVTISFLVSVPASLQNNDWALRMTPYITRNDEIIRLDNILIRGDRFKQVQDGEYKRYQKYLTSIVPDSVDFFKYFSNYEDFDIDEARRLAEIKKASGEMQGTYNEYQTRYDMLYGTKDNTSSSIEEDYLGQLRRIWSKDSLHLVTIRTQKELSRYYNNRKIERNEAIIAKKEELYNRSLKYTKTDNLRFDMVSKEGTNIQFHYSQDIATDQSRMLYLNVEGELVYLDGTRKSLPLSDTIAYYVSSIVNFIDYTPRYLMKIKERFVSENIRAHIAFQTGKTELDTTYSDNAVEVARISDAIRSIYEKGDLVVDSIMLTAMSSPDGRYEKNEELAELRAYSLNDYLVQILTDEILEQKKVQDTIPQESTFESNNLLDSLLANENDTSFFMSASIEVENTPVKSKRNFQRESYWEARHLLKVGWVAEDWDQLKRFVQEDSVLTNAQKKRINLVLNSKKDNPDAREYQFRIKYPKEFGYVKEVYYPQLRSVTLNFAMHRKDMVKDTIYTQELDTVYEKGLALMKERQYEEAIKVLDVYKDLNTAICYMSLGRDYTAYDLFSSLDSLSAQAEYMMAILERRMGNPEKARDRYLKACQMNSMFIHRGNMDPEINELKEMYQLDRVLNKKEDEE